MYKEVDISIVGGGPGGMLLAYLLAKKGIHVLLLERTNELARAFRGEHINEDGEAILKSYGLYEAVEKRGLLKMEAVEYWQKGEKIKTILPDASVGHLGIHVPQAHLLEAILEQAEAYPTFEYQLNTRVTELLQNEEGRYIGVKAKQGDMELTVMSHLVIGADGRYSTVRKKAQIYPTIRKHGFDLLWARIPAPINYEPVIKMALVDGMQIALFAQTNGYVQIGWHIEEGSYGELRKQPFEPFITKLVEAFPDLREAVQFHIQSWQDFVVLDVFSSQTECWGAEGLALMGDAAHTMTPTGAYGLNEALKDAVALAELIDEQTIQRLELLTCERQRKDEVTKLQALQREKEQQFAAQFLVHV